MFRDKDAERRYQARWRKERRERHARTLLAGQNGLCAICAVPLEVAACGTKHGWHRDHDHETGLYRSVLCSRCNLLLGMARDNPALLRVAAAYLDRWRLEHAAMPDNYERARSVLS